MSMTEAIASKMFKKMTVGDVAKVGLGVYFGLDSYKTAREEGHGVVMSGAKAVGENIMMDAMGFGWYLGYQALTGIPAVGVKTAETLSQAARSMSTLNGNVPFQNATFNDSPQAYTMRQAGMQLAKASKYNLQQAMLGNEAQYLHL